MTPTFSLETTTEIQRKKKLNALVGRKWKSKTVADSRVAMGFYLQRNATLCCQYFFFLYLAGRDDTEYTKTDK